jgi:hypothetical protein
MAFGDPMTDPMMLEIDDELRARQLKAFWEKYGQWLIGLMLIVVIATAVGVIWHNVLNDALTKQTNELLLVLQNETKQPDHTQETAKTLADLNKEADFPLQAVVGLYRAQKLEQGKDLKAAQDVYKNMMSQPRLSKIVQDLARVHYVRLGVVQNQDAKDLLATIEPLVKDDNASFRSSALELKGLLLVQSGKQAEANKIFTQLTSDDNAPNGLRQRAKSMISYGN